TIQRAPRRAISGSKTARQAKTVPPTSMPKCSAIAATRAKDSDTLAAGRRYRNGEKLRPRSNAFMTTARKSHMVRSHHDTESGRRPARLLPEIQTRFRVRELAVFGWWR